MRAQAKSVVSFVRRHKYAASLIYIISIFIVFANIYLRQPPQYEVSAIVSMSLDNPYLPRPDISRPPVTNLGRLAQTAVAILRSENVIRNAIKKVGVDTMLSPPSGPFNSDYSGIKSIAKIFGLEFIFWPRLTPIDRAIVSARKALVVKREGMLDSDIVTIEFTHRDPEAAVNFTNALLAEFTAEYLHIQADEGAIAFYTQQQSDNLLTLNKAVRAFEEFASINSVFQIDQQVSQLVDELNKQSFSWGRTKGEIIQKDKEAEVIPILLAQMKPFSQLPQVARLIDPTNKTNTTINYQLPIASDPPILLVRVYQDTITRFVTLQSDLGGLRALEEYQKKVIKKLNEELVALESKKERYRRLHLEVTNLSELQERFQAKLVELELAKKLKVSNLSNVNIIQQATKPLRPKVPWVIVILALLACAGPFISLLFYRVYRDSATVG